MLEFADRFRLGRNSLIAVGVQVPLSVTLTVTVNINVNVIKIIFRLLRDCQNKVLNRYEIALDIFSRII